MMPIYGGHGIFHSLPDHIKHYTNFICQTCPTLGWRMDDHGDMKPRVMYLTIQEGWVPVGESQRRPGLHIERPGAITCKGSWTTQNEPAFQQIAWGLGLWGADGLPVDGIYMASTVDDSCAIWPVTIENPAKISDKHGGIEHMRPVLGDPTLLKANQMCWFTDRTPHESLPLKAPATDPEAKMVYRQFFRLVAGPISVWYAKHNTPNPLGIEPDAVISYEDKFST